MGTERRTAEGSLLRRFVDDQLDYLGSLFSQWDKERLNKKRQLQEEKKIIETVVEASDKRIRAVNGYTEKLRPTTRALYQHITQLADEFPVPIRLDAAAFSQEPTINALFVSQEDIVQLFQSDQNIRQFLNTQSPLYPKTFFGLLGSLRSEKTKLGMGMVGDIVVRDLVQETVSFSDHEIIAPCPTEEAVLSELKRYLFDLALVQLSNEMTQKKQADSTLSQRRNPQAQAESLNNPEVYITALTHQLDLAIKQLTLKQITMKVSKLGVKLEADDKQASNEFDIYELYWKDHPHRIITPVTCTIDEAPKNEWLPPP